MTYHKVDDIPKIWLSMLSLIWYLTLSPHGDLKWISHIGSAHFVQAWSWTIDLRAIIIHEGSNVRSYAIMFNQ